MLWDQFDLYLLHPSYPPILVDYAVIIDAISSKQPFPILLCELSRTPCYGEYLSHKDEEELAVCMGAALLKLVGACSHWRGEVVSSVKIFGLLLGATDFEVWVMYLDFGAVMFRRPGEGLRPFTKIFKTSRKQWRFRVAANDYNYLSDLDLGDLNDFICSGVTPSFTGPSTPYNFQQNRPTVDPPPTSVEYDFNPIEEESDDNDYASAFLSIAQLWENFSIKFLHAQLNNRGMLVFYRLMRLIEEEASRISARLAECPSPPDDSFHYSPERADLMFKGRTNTPTGSELSSPSRGTFADIAGSNPPTPV